MPSTVAVPVIDYTSGTPVDVDKALITVATQAKADLDGLLGSATLAGSANFKARLVATAVDAYAGTGTATLTASATGTASTMDGVAPALGDVVLFIAGVTNVTAADTGPWVVTTLGATGVKWVLQRPSWWTHAATAQYGQVIHVGPDGTLFKNSEWKTMVKGAVVGTTDAQWYPGRVIQQVALSSGVATVTNVPIYSATKSQAVITMAAVGGTMTGIVGFQPLALTPGPIGTASFVATAVSTAQATTGGGSPTVNVGITNW